MSLFRFFVKLFLKLCAALQMKPFNNDYFSNQSSESDGRTSSSASPPFPSERKINNLASNGSLPMSHDISHEKPSKSISPLLHLVCDALDRSKVDESIAPKDELLFDPFASDTTNDDNFVVHKVLMNGNDLLDDLTIANSLMIPSRSLDEREENLLSTVIEEEHEQDSLEEFIKHETECGCQSSGTINGTNPNADGGNCCSSNKSGLENDPKKGSKINHEDSGEERNEKLVEVPHEEKISDVVGSNDDERNGYVFANGGRQKCDLLHDHDEDHSERRMMVMMMMDGKEKVDAIDGGKKDTFSAYYSFSPFPTKNRGKKGSYEWTCITIKHFFAHSSRQWEVEWRWG